MGLAVFSKKYIFIIRSGFRGIGGWVLNWGSGQANGTLTLKNLTKEPKNTTAKLMALVRKEQHL